MAKSYFCVSTVFPLLSMLCFSTTAAAHVFKTSKLTHLYSESYTTFKALETGLVKDEMQLHNLRHTFFPVVVNRFWSADDINVISITTCLLFTSLNNSRSASVDEISQSKSIKCWDFYWTSSQLMAITSADVLLAMEPVYFGSLYSSVVGSLQRGKGIVLNLHIPPSELPQNTSDHQLIQTLGMLLSWAKAYAVENGVPRQWDPQYQGYVTRKYTYTAKEPLYDAIMNSDKLINTALWVTFTIINILIPLVLYKRGVELTIAVSKSGQKFYQAYPAIFQASGGVFILINTVYLMGMIGIHVYGGMPSILECILSTTKHKCELPAMKSFNIIVSGVLITKIALLLPGVLIEFAAAVKITRHLSRSFWTTSTGKYAHVIRIAVVVFAIWHCLMFVHIILGLSSIPLAVGFIISPVHSILHTGTICSFVVFLIVSLASIIHAKPWKPKQFLANICTLTLNLLMAGLLIAVVLTYFLVVRGGVNMSTIKGLLLTLLPTLPLPMLTWMAKKKFYDEGSHNKPSPVTDSRMELLKMEENHYD